MTVKYVKPVSKLHWLFACEAGRGEVKYRDWDDKNWIRLDSTRISARITPESWWILATKADPEFLLRIRIDESDSEDGVPETDK